MIERKYISFVAFLLLSAFPVSFSYLCELCDPDEHLWDSKSLSTAFASNCGILYYDFMDHLQADSWSCNTYKRQYQESCCNPNPCKLCGPEEALQWSTYVTSAMSNCDTLSNNMREYTAESEECIMDRSLYQEDCCVDVTPWPTATPISWPTSPPVVPVDNSGFIILGVCASVVCIAFLLKINLQQRFETVQTQQGRPTGHQQATSSASPEAIVNTARQELFLEKFLFQKVLSDKSNIYATSIRSLDAERGNNAHTLSKEEEEEGNNDDDDNDHPVGDDPKLTPDEGKISSWRRMLSSWRKPAKDDECCICLENYEPGQLICAAVTDKCNHAFHKGCMKNWFESNDTCPICRTNFVES